MGGGGGEWGGGVCVGWGWGRGGEGGGGRRMKGGGEGEEGGRSDEFPGTMLISLFTGWPRARCEVSGGAVFSDGQIISSHTDGRQRQSH
jgi:hypothetical protein